MKTSIARFAAVAAIAVIGLPGVASAGRAGGGGNPDPHIAGRCNQPFVLFKISDLAPSEKERARKVNRNDNNYVCRKDIPGQGGGNTGNNSNIKDDKL